MAGLDDFFAKKDRKKPKGKKFTTTDEIAKKLEETGKRIEKAKKDKPMNEGDEPQQLQDEDEWKVFEEEKKDYSGLKIGNLTVNDSHGTESDDERGMADNCSDNGESGEMGEKHTGPWKKPEQAPQPEPVVEVAPPPQPPPTTTTAQPSSYKPPHLRNMPAVSPSPRMRSKNIAPDIHSEEYFPTLNSNKPPGTDPKRRRDEGTFEEVRNRGGSRGYTMQDAHPPSAKLSLGNKYGALSQDQS